MIQELNGQIIFVSIFYSESSWSQLAIDKLAPTMAIAEKNFNAKFILSFNKDRGDSVNLSIWVSDEKKYDCLDFIHDELSLYILKNPSIGMQVEEILLFENFTNNRLHYRVHSFDPQLYPIEMRCPSEWSDVSRVMLNRLEPEDYTIETLHTHSIYVSTLLFLTNTFLRDHLKHFVEKRLKQLEVHSEIIEKYSSLKFDLLEIKVECAAIIESNYSSQPYLYEIVSSIDKLVNKVALRVNEKDKAELTIYYILSAIRTIYGIQRKSFELNDYLLFKLFV